jgi:hypothetical protein
MKKFILLHLRQSHELAKETLLDAQLPALSHSLLQQTKFAPTLSNSSTQS